MEKDKSQKDVVAELISALDQMIGYHRNLLECCREEKTALAEANLKGIQEKTHSKEFIIENILTLDKRRAELAGEVAFNLVGEECPITLTDIILSLEGPHPDESLKLRSQMTTLVHLVGSIQKSNDQNREFLRASVEHIEAMKKNVLGEAKPKTETYGNKAKVQTSKNQNSRLISKEV